MSYTSPGRAGTESPPAVVPLRTRDRAQSYLHRRLHSNTTSSSTAKPSHLRRAKDHVQSAIELKPPISFENVLKRDKKSADSSRRGSGSNLNKQQQRDFREWNAQQQARLELEERKQVTAQDVAKARAENKQRADILQQRLNDIEETSMGFTHELDQTYYTMLERAAELQSTVSQLQTLLKSTTALSQSFRDETLALEKETAQTFDAFDNLDEREKTLNDLVIRLQSSKTDTRKLDQRLEAARNRVAEYESQENAAMRKRRQQWHATWGSLLIAMTLIIALLMLNNYQQVRHHVKDLAKHATEAGHIVEDIITPVLDNIAAKSSPSHDPYLDKLFDDL